MIVVCPPFIATLSTCALRQARTAFTWWGRREARMYGRRPLEVRHSNERLRAGLGRKEHKAGASPGIHPHRSNNARPLVSAFATDVA